MTAPQVALSSHACPHCRAVFRTAFARCPLDGTPLEELLGDPLSGSEFADRYIIEECVGEGGMGRVYRARHRRVSRRFAVKVLFGDHAADTKMQERFAREAESASRLNHPNVISVIDFGETKEGLLYLVMDYVEGPNLSTVMAEHAPMRRERVLKFVEQLAKGLAHAHKRGLIHRDFKGENVIITNESGEEQAKIVDFGIAMMAGNEQRSRKLTTEGMVLGTPATMAPEQAVGGTVDERTDLFSLGIIMYEMLTGVLPFDGTPLEIARMNLTAEPPRFAQRVPGLIVDGDLETLCFHLMAKKPEGRPQSAKDVLRLVHALRGEPSAEFRMEPSLPGFAAGVPGLEATPTPMPIPSELTPSPVPAPGPAVPRRAVPNASRASHPPPMNMDSDAATVIAEFHPSQDTGERYPQHAPPSRKGLYVAGAFVLAAVALAVVLAMSGGGEESTAGGDEGVAAAPTNGAGETGDTADSPPDTNRPTNAGAVAAGEGDGANAGGDGDGANAAGEGDGANAGGDGDGANAAGDGDGDSGELVVDDDDTAVDEAAKREAERERKRAERKAKKKERELRAAEKKLAEKREREKKKLAEKREREKKLAEKRERERKEAERKAAERKAKEAAAKAGPTSGAWKQKYTATLNRINAAIKVNSSEGRRLKNRLNRLSFSEGMRKPDYRKRNIGTLRSLLSQANAILKAGK